MVTTTVSQEELASRADELVERVQHGELAIVETSGKEAIVLLDALDYRLLRVLAACAANTVTPESGLRSREVTAIRDYLAERIGLGKVAELLHLSRLELTERFQRLGVPLRIGPADEEQALAEVAVALARKA